ncbi:hypothetical protein [Litorimonas sp. WD9-15]|uniref:hypothetical protein n=1 Tax=Litorimonas sp. WD9-15 TaxID=3418716 RepID=UPI003D08392F
MNQPIDNTVPASAPAIPSDPRLEEALRLFSLAQGKKLQVKGGAGAAGWDDPSWTIDEVVSVLRELVDKGDPIDVANFALFWWVKQTQPELTAPPVAELGPPFHACTACQAVTATAKLTTRPHEDGGMQKACPVCGKPERFLEPRQTSDFDVPDVGGEG